MNLPSWFTRFAKATSRLTGRPGTFAVATGVVLVWAAPGPVFGYSDTWQLVINTSTSSPAIVDRARLAIDNAASARLATNI